MACTILTFCFFTLALGDSAHGDKTHPTRDKIKDVLLRPSEKDGSKVGMLYHNVGDGYDDIRLQPGWAKVAQGGQGEVFHAFFDPSGKVDLSKPDHSVLIPVVIKVVSYETQSNHGMLQEINIVKYLAENTQAGVMNNYGSIRIEPSNPEEKAIAILVSQAGICDFFDFMFYSSLESSDPGKKQKIRLINNGEINHRLLTIADVAQIVHDTLQGFVQLHNQGIAHRDVKIENYLVVQIEPLRLVLLDLGFACIQSETHLTGKFGDNPYPDCDLTRSLLGSKEYIAPEIWNPDSEGYRMESDIWSLGITFLAVFLGRQPGCTVGCIPDQEKEPNWMKSRRVRRTAFSCMNKCEAPIRQWVSSDFKKTSSLARETVESPIWQRIVFEVILPMLTVDPAKRPTVHELLKTMNSIYKIPDLPERVDRPKGDGLIMRTLFDKLVPLKKQHNWSLFPVYPGVDWNSIIADMLKNEQQPERSTSTQQQQTLEQQPVGSSTKQRKKRKRQKQKHAPPNT